MDEQHETKQDEAQAEGVGFWKRMFGGKEAPEGEPEAVEAPEPAHNKPRKRQKTIFDKAEQQQKRRYAKAAAMRREKLANSIGEKVEEVINHRLVTGEERMAEVGEAFGEMNVLLGAIGRNLDGQSRRAQHMADTLDALPIAAEKERVVLEAIAERLEGQAASVEGVPEVVSLVRQGSKVGEERLMVLRGLKHELRQQREQQTQVLDVLRKSARAFEERMTSLEETMAKSMVESRSDATSLRQAVERNTEELRGEAQREAQRNAELIHSLQVVSSQLVEGNALATANAVHQEQEAQRMHDGQKRLVESVVRSQTQTLCEMKALQEETREREEEMAKRNRLTLVGSTGFLGILAAALIAFQAPQPAPEPVIVPVRTASPLPAKQDEEQEKANTTLPASMPR